MPFDIRSEPARGGFMDPRMLSLNGLEQVLFMRDHGVRSPNYHLTGFECVEAGVGWATFRMPVTPWLATTFDGIVAGWSTFVADASLGAAVMTTLPPGSIVTTSQLTMNFLRPATTRSGHLIARARTIHGGKAVGLSEVTVEDGAGRILAHGTSRLVVKRFPVPDEPPPPARPAVYDTPDPFERPLDGLRYTTSADIGGYAGHELFAAYAKGEAEAPPFSYLLGTRFVEASEGEILATFPASRWLCSPAGAMYGGSLALVADTICSAAFQSILPSATTPFGVLDQSMHFLRPVLPDDGEMTVRARVVHGGKSLAVAEFEIRNPAGKLVARGTESALLLRDRAWPTEAPVVADEPQTDEDDVRPM